MALNTVLTVVSSAVVGALAHTSGLMARRRYTQVNVAVALTLPAVGLCRWPEVAILAGITEPRHVTTSTVTHWKPSKPIYTA